MTAKQSTNWFWSDWAGDEAVRSLTPAERGLWIDLLALAARGNPTGYVVDARGDPVAVEQIAHFANCSAAEVLSLIDGILAKGVASRDRTGRLFNRRMLRDIELATKRRRAGHSGGVATALKWQGKNGVPGHLPEHLPGTPGTRPSKKKDLTSTFVGTARDAAAHDTAAAVDAAAADGLAKQAREAVRQDTGIGSGELAENIQKRGWVRPC